MRPNDREFLSRSHVTTYHSRCMLLAFVTYVYACSSARRYLSLTNAWRWQWKTIVLGGGQVHRSGPKSGLTSTRYNSDRVILLQTQIVTRDNAPPSRTDGYVCPSKRFVYECSLTTLIHIYPAALSMRSRSRTLVRL